jgi:hypothetical protein
VDSQRAIVWRWVGKPAGWERVYRANRRWVLGSTGSAIAAAAERGDGAAEPAGVGGGVRRANFPSVDVVSSSYHNLWPMVSVTSRPLLRPQVTWPLEGKHAFFNGLLGIGCGTLAK